VASGARARGGGVWLAALTVVLCLWYPTFISSLGLVPHTWAYQELLVNWEGGFVRRGLYGSVLLWLHNAFGVDALLFTGIVFVVGTILEVVLLFGLLWQYRGNPFVVLLVALSPVTLLFGVYDIGGYWRKELFLNLAILTHAWVARAAIRGSISRDGYIAFVALVMAPWLLVNTLIYEVQGFFLPIHLAITLSVLRITRSEDDGVVAYVAIGAAYVLALVPFLLSVLFHGDPANNAVMFDAVKDWSGVSGNAALVAHGWTLAESYGLSAQILANPISALAYIGGFLVGPVMLMLLILTQIDPDIEEVGEAAFPIWTLFPPLALFIVGWDYGRWIHMIAIAAVAYVLHYPTRPDAVAVLVRRGPYAWIVPFLVVSWSVLYIVAWYLPHCCQVETIGGGFLPAVERFFRPLATAF
jgi:hypothetical protein